MNGTNETGRGGGMARRIAVIGVIVAIPLLIAAVSQALSGTPGEPRVPARVQIGDGASQTVPTAPPSQAPAPPSPAPTTTRPESPVPTKVPPPPPVYDDDDDDDGGEGTGDDDGDDGGDDG
jgi:hypothetical protein